MDGINIRIPMKCISKDNEKLRNKVGMVFLSKRFKDFEQDIKVMARSQLLKNPFWHGAYKGKIDFTLNCYFKNKVHPDTQNLPKGVCDALQGIVYDNDRQIKKITTESFEGCVEEYFEIIVQERLN